MLAPGGLTADALAALVRTLGGAAWPPSPARVQALAASFRAATLGGVRVLPAGKLHPGGWLLVREAAALAPPIPAAAAARWDGRFRLDWAASPPAGTEIGALAADAARFRTASDLPACGAANPAGRAAARKTGGGAASRLC